MTRKTKILQVLPSLNVEDVPHSRIQLAKFLVQSGYDSYVLSNGGNMRETLEKAGVKHFNLPVHKKDLFSFRTISKIRSLLLKEQFDLIHVRSRIPTWLVYIALKQIPPDNRPKLVTTFNGYYSIDEFSETIIKGDAIICLSKSVRNFILDHFAFTKKKDLNVIHKGVDSKKLPYGFEPNSKWLQQWTDESDSFKDKFKITLPGRISSRKGLHDFLHIFYYLKKDGLPIHGLIIGSVDSQKENYYSRLKSDIRRLGLTDDISILNDRRDLREIMKVSDLVLSCSIIPEAFNKACLMALSIGVPVIAYSHGILKEQLNALYPYGMVEANKKSTMRLKIREFYKLKDKPKPNKNDQFTTDCAHKKVLSVYEELLLKSA